MKDIAIVILNWNGIKFLNDFLPSVIAYSSDCRIILADNASTDNSVQFVKEKYPSIEIVVNESNGGFAKGYNDALKKIDAKYYLLLNSDIEVTENWIKPLFEVIQNENVAGCQPKILSYHKKDEFEHAGACGGFLDKNYFPFCRGRIFEVFEKDNGQYNGETDIFWATGAAFLIKADLYHLVGGLDEAFFAHMEEIDICWRLKKLGYTFKVVPSSKIYHVGGGTLPYLSPKKSFLNFRNSLFMITKNHEGWLFPKLIYRMILDGIAGIRFLIRGEFAHLFSVLKAHYELYKRFPTLLKQRKSIKKQSTHFNNKGLYNASILWAKYFKRINKFSDLNKRFFP